MTTSGSSSVPRPPRRASDAGRSRVGDRTRPIAIDRRILRSGRSMTVLLGIVALVIAGAFAFSLFVRPVQTWFDQDERLDQRAEQLSQLEAVNADLRAEVERLKTDDGVREAAREELGFIEQDEVRRTVTDAPGVPVDLPAGWPYDLITRITDFRRSGPAPAD